MNVANAANAANGARIGGGAAGAARKWRGAAPCLLAALLLLPAMALAACDDSGGDGGGQAAPEPAAAAHANEPPANEAPANGVPVPPGQAAPAEGADLMSPFSPYPEPITLTTARFMNRGGQIGDWESTTDNIHIDVIKQKLNVDMVVAWETSPDQYDQRLALSIAGGTLPDMFAITQGNYLTLKALVDNSMLADLTEAYNKCIGGYAAEFLKAFNGEQLTACTWDGRIMAVPQPPTGHNYNQLWVRKDWLDKVGLPLPTTLGEIKAAALAFVDAGLGGARTVGIVVDPIAPLGSDSSSFLSFATAANALGAFPKTWIYGPGGEIAYGSVMPEMKTALAVFADWYASGVMDREFMTYQNMDAVTPALREGRCGMYFGASWSAWTMADSVIQHPEMDWVGVLGPVDAEGNYTHTNSKNPNSFLAVSADCEHPEAAVKAANVDNEFVLGGYNGDPAIAAAYKRSQDVGSLGRTLSPIPSSIASEFDHELLLGRAVFDYIATGELSLPPTATAGDYENAEIAFNWAKTRDIRDTAGYSNYNAFYIMDQISKAGNLRDVPVAYSYSTASMADYWPALSTLESEMIVQIISGQRPLDYFDEFVATWRASGGDIIAGEIEEVAGR
jgi:putative aldouronate transport system substrate-binding protein